MVVDGLRRVSVGAHLLPDLGDFFEVVSNAGVAGVPAALDERAREWQKLDVAVVQLEQRFDVAPSDCIEGELDDLHVLLGHRRPVVKRLKGFEPSTFCMASSRWVLSWARKMPANGRLPTA